MSVIVASVQGGASARHIPVFGGLYLCTWQRSHLFLWATILRILQCHTRALFLYLYQSFASFSVQPTQRLLSELQIDYPTAEASKHLGQPKVMFQNKHLVGYTLSSTELGEQKEVTWSQIQPRGWVGSDDCVVLGQKPTHLVSIDSQAPIPLWTDQV